MTGQRAIQPGNRFRAGKRLWSAADDALMRARYPHEPTPTIARALRRTVESVYARAKKLGLKKSAAYLASPHACRLRRGDNVGARFRYRKGHVPANKGLRRPGWGPGRMREHQFKGGTRNGQAAKRYMPVGSTRLVDGYVYRKVSDTGNVPWTRNWTLEHRRVWVAAHGPLPRGHALAFKNGDRTDVRLDNLECIPRRELMLRNTVHNYPKPLAETIQLLGALKNSIRRRTQRHAAKQD
jgi:hypothetical protein